MSRINMFNHDSRCLSFVGVCMCSFINSFMNTYMMAYIHPNIQNALFYIYSTSEESALCLGTNNSDTSLYFCFKLC